MAFDAYDHRYFATVKALRTRLQGFAVQQFRAGQWRDPDLDRFVALLVPVMLGAERSVSSLTAAWLSRQLTKQTGRPVTVRVDPAKASGKALRGVDPAEVYSRPYVKVRTDLAAGQPLATAVAAGTRLVLSLVATNLQLAKTHTARQVLSTADGVVGYRRVLTGSKSCALCYVASTQRYHRGDLLPIHPACDCGVEPIVGSADPGQILDPQVLEGTHEAIAERFGGADRGGRSPDYRKITIEDHGELGPVLTVADHRFTHL